MATQQQHPLDLAPWAGADKTGVHSGFTIASEVRQSGIPGAGRGRFLLEPVKKGAVVRRTLLVDGAATSGEPSSDGTTVVCRNAADLERNFRYEDGADTTNLEQVVNFGGTPYNVDKGNDTIYHWTPCNWFNHAPGKQANVIIVLSDVDPTHVRVVALRNIAAGEELYQDYRSFKNPSWFKDWCVATCGGKVDTETLGCEISPDAEPPVVPSSPAKGAASDSEQSTAASG